MECIKQHLFMYYIMFMEQIRNINIIVMLLLVIQVHLCLKEHLK